ncbi:outer membrane beta-barrel protein [Rhodoplanes sp. TEM]|uniref:Outer membrane beta-barrel protein n=1 Tax=Rhodoplanes tepidamans TaxID=200616 RepID=A0ABT5JJI7_RHOTP|nr:MULTISPECIES: outer membrane beta-barrel protein [Rhodoplanes]MDC7789901.1 outer membrane beta-barrel protein [Rhodoplanes tepidamans]MDC7986651.1 outer membrane beta-barrel protein [Rhodoplanes sp. TEM]MDQ0354045.1 opacity protein-like surface antigen [Rhodoplanes tepidamans]
MRIAGLCGLFLVGLASLGPAHAADMPFLRGSQGLMPSEPVYFRWQGVYVGGQASYSSGKSDFSQGTGDLVSYMLRNTIEEAEMGVSSWTTLPSNNGMTGTGWGGFIGYNAQWDDAVLGLEFNYTRVGLKATAADSMGRYNLLSDSVYHLVDLTSTAGVDLTDIATLRLRGGWAASWFMPYAFIGVAAGRADVTRSATVAGYTSTVSPTDSGFTGWTPAYAETRSDNRSGAWGFGYSAGAGIDVALMANVFLRAEYEYVYFGDFQGMKVTVNTVRGGLGFKF